MLVDNRRHGQVGKLRNEHLTSGNGFDALSAYASVFAYDVLRDSLSGCAKARFLLPATGSDPDTPYPTDTAGLQARFIDTLEKVGGAWAEPDTGESPEHTMRRALADKLDAVSLIASNVPEIRGNRRVRADDTPASLHDIDVAVLRARFGVAETGSVCFTEAELTVNAVAYLAQHLVVLLDPATIETNLHRAYQRDDYKTARYTVFHTGPSATADIEGVLVRGAQGVRSLTIIPA